MKKLLVGVLLAGIAVPAQSALMFEIRGVAGIEYIQQDPEYEWTDGGAAYFSLSGQCYALCLSAGPSGLIFDFDFYSFGHLDFTFSHAPISNYLDGIFHPGAGIGVIAEGRINFTRYTLFATRARMYDDPNIIENSYPDYNLDIGPRVPEPATWAMMIGGFALVGTSMRRRGIAVSFA